MTPQPTIDQIKSATDLTALVEETTGPLRRHPGHQPTLALCPWHDDHDPSLAIYADHAHCFGCGWHGDCFDWLMQRDGLDFRAALEQLARRASVPLDSLTPAEQGELYERRRYEDALTAAARHFARQLQQSPPALDYVRARAWSDDAIAAEGLGYADGGPLPHLEDERARRVVAALNRWAGQAGGALVYPHRDGGRVVYLSARSIEGKRHYNPPADLAGPRRPYPNALYSTTADRIIIVEGQGDTLILNDWGMSAIALAGSTLTGDLATRLARLRERDAALYVVPDSDGRTDLPALAEALGPLLHVVRLPQGAGDTNDYATGGATAHDFWQLLNRAPTWIDLQLKETTDARGADHDRELACLFDLLAELPPLPLARYKQRVTGELREIGARDFDRLLKIARGRDRPPADDDRYTVADGRLCLLRCASDGQQYPQPLCNFTARIVEDVACDDGAEVRRQFTVVGRLENGHSLPPVRIDANRFAAMNWISDGWGVHAVVRAGSSTRDQLREAIQLGSTAARSRYVYTYTGWREINGQRVYLHADGALGADGVTVELGRELGRYRLPPHPQDVTSAMQASLRFLQLAPETVTVPLWAAAFLAPLNGVISLDAVLWVYGATGTLKSTLAALVLCHYGPSFTWKSLPATWASTRHSLEATCFQAKDALLVIDDFAPQSDPHQARQMESNAAYIIRNVGNRSARGRLRPDLSQRPLRPPRGLVLSTGEQVPGGHSVTARMFVVEMRPDDVCLERLTAAQAESGRYSHALAGYLLWLAGQWERLAHDLPRRQSEQRARLLADMDDSHLRLPDALVTLYLGLDLGLTYAVEVEALTGAQADAWRERGWQALKAGAQAQAHSIKQQRPTLLFLRVLGDLLAQGRVYLLARRGEEKIGGDAPGAELLGWYDDEFVYLLPDAPYNRVARFLRDEGAHFPVPQLTLRKYLHEEGYLLRRDPDRYTDVVRVGAETHRAMWIYRAQIEAYISLSPRESGNSGNNGNDSQSDDVLF